MNNMTDDIRQRVFNALNNSMANKYRLQNWSADDITDDLIRYCGDLENSEPEELKPFVIEWQESVDG